MSRLMSRDGLTEEEARWRIGAQIPLETKTLSADEVIDNSQDQLYTQRQTKQLLENMKRLSRCRWVVCRALYVVLFTVFVLFLLSL